MINNQFVGKCVETVTTFRAESDFAQAKLDHAAKFKNALASIEKLGLKDTPLDSPVVDHRLFFNNTLNYFNSSLSDRRQTNVGQQISSAFKKKIETSCNPRFEEQKFSESDAQELGERFMRSGESVMRGTENLHHRMMYASDNAGDSAMRGIKAVKGKTLRAEKHHKKTSGDDPDLDKKISGDDPDLDKKISGDCDLNITDSAVELRDYSFSAVGDSLNDLLTEIPNMITELEWEFLTAYCNILHNITENFILLRLRSLEDLEIAIARGSDIINSIRGDSITEFDVFSSRVYRFFNIDTLTDVFLRYFRIEDIEHLQACWTFLEFCPTISVLTLNYTLIVLFGINTFLMMYFSLKQPNVLKDVIKKCILILQNRINFSWLSDHFTRLDNCFTAFGINRRMLRTYVFSLSFFFVGLFGLAIQPNLNPLLLEEIAGAVISSTDSNTSTSTVIQFRNTFNFVFKMFLKIVKKLK